MSGESRTRKVKSELSHLQSQNTGNNALIQWLSISPSARTIPSGPSKLVSHRVARCHLMWQFGPAHTWRSLTRSELYNQPESHARYSTTDTITVLPPTLAALWSCTTVCISRSNRWALGWFPKDRFCGAGCEKKGRCPECKAPEVVLVDSARDGNKGMRWISGLVWQVSLSWWRESSLPWEKNVSRLKGPVIFKAANISCSKKSKVCFKCNGKRW